MFVAKQLQQLNRTYTHYGIRQANNGKSFYLYGTKSIVVCAVPKKTESGFEEERVGYCTFKFDPILNNMHITYITVYEYYQRQGIGDQMLEYVKLVANKYKAKTITLDRLQVFTDGDKKVAFYADELTQEDLIKLKSQGKDVEDKNLKFYVKHGFIKDTGRRPPQPHLVPMVFPRVKPTKIGNPNLPKILKFKASSVPKIIEENNSPLLILNPRKFL